MANKNSKTMVLAEGAIMLALSAGLSFIKFHLLPWGGSVTLLSMLPIIVFSIRRGVGNGLAVSFLYSLIQLGQGVSEGLFGWGLTPVMLVSCVFLDYIGAFTVIGLGGLFRKKGFAGWTAGTAMAVTLRFVLHVFSGVVIWHSSGLIWEGISTENEWLYSILYNGAYMLPELIFTVIGAVILFKVPQTKRIVSEFM